MAVDESLLFVRIEDVQPSGAVKPSPLDMVTICGFVATEVTEVIAMADGDDSFIFY